MQAKDYKLIATAIWTAGYIKDKNKVRQQAKEDRARLIMNCLIGEFSNYPNFDEKLFEQQCKGGEY